MTILKYQSRNNELPYFGDDTLIQEPALLYDYLNDHQYPYQKTQVYIQNGSSRSSLIANAQEPHTHDQEIADVMDPKDLETVMDDSPSIVS